MNHPGQTSTHPLQKPPGNFPEFPRDPSSKPKGTRKLRSVVTHGKTGGTPVAYSDVESLEDA